jgi:hypothetical protein
MSNFSNGANGFVPEINVMDNQASSVRPYPVYDDLRTALRHEKKHRRRLEEEVEELKRNYYKISLILRWLYKDEADLRLQEDDALVLTPFSEMGIKKKRKQIKQNKRGMRYDPWNQI